MLYHYEKPYRLGPDTRYFMVLEELEDLWNGLLSAGIPRWQLLEAFLFSAVEQAYLEYGPELALVLIEAMREKALRCSHQDKICELFRAQHPDWDPNDIDTWNQFHRPEPQWWRRSELNHMHGV